MPAIVGTIDILFTAVAVDGGLSVGSFSAWPRGL